MYHPFHIFHSYVAIFIPVLFDFNSDRPETSQREIFQDVESYVEAAVQGYNSTVFAYGQTGAGKCRVIQC